MEKKIKKDYEKRKTHLRGMIQATEEMMDKLNKDLSYYWEELRILNNSK